MSEKQQTAVQWLLAQLNSVKPTQFCSIDTIKKWTKQALEMEREQLYQALYVGLRHGYNVNNTSDTQNTIEP